MITAGTGVPQTYYHRFAKQRAERGFACQTYDMRGVGKSRQGNLAQLDMRYADWGRLDMTAALDFLHDQFRFERLSQRHI